jgi:hypothetical protein
MFFLAGSAATSALDLISALQQTLTGKNSSTASTPPAAGQSFDPAAGGDSASGATSAPATSPLAPTTMGAMLTVQGGNGQTLVNGDAFSAKLFGMLDGNNDGSISQSEFEAAFSKNGDSTKADAIFARLDANQDGNVSPDELTNALSGQGQGQGGGGQVHHRRHHHGMFGAGGASATTGSGDPNDPFSTSASSGSNDPFAGDQSQSVTNADGSTTTTITYADGSQVSMTSPAASSTGSSQTAWEHNFIERMIQRQAQMMMASPTGQGFAISA